MPNKTAYINYTLTVDPGWNTGLAYWIGDKEPIVSIIKEPPRRKKIKLEPTRLKYMFDKFEAYVKSRSIETCVIEGVEMWSGSTKSMTSAARGNLFSLAYIVGGYINICYRLGIHVKLVYPRGGGDRVMWKGQLDATKLAARIHRINSKIYPEHIREAVGIGFSIMGIL
ncbi:MAG: hypothetical protein HC773_01360 [Scytonema sp. CRU_2_7]|nr:hypothetical protein [Scytonema sp. CRU_2_7]